MKCKSIYANISKIVKGEQVVMLDSVSQASGDADKYKLEAFTEAAEVGVPEFWLKAMENSKYFYNMNEKDKEVLKFLEDIYIEIDNNKTVYLLLIPKYRISKFIFHSELTHTSTLQM
jgi:hypothetical protein